MADANASNGDSDAAATSSSILNAISELNEEFTLRIDGLFSAIKGIQGDLKAVSLRVTEAEDRISTNQDEVASLKTQTSTMKAAIEELVSKVDDLENPSPLLESSPGHEGCQEQVGNTLRQPENHVFPQHFRGSGQTEESLRLGEERAGFPLHLDSAIWDNSSSETLGDY
ncbi:hypothetical protein XENOCAPTIV_004808 [Xenoophorus captivus]|uniref:Uncharacterized protein n=1 Tax=Xenoophorus captivus TaxID=1517983 RepID=A0ABV0Q826_9TELE